MPLFRGTLALTNVRGVNSRHIFVVLLLNLLKLFSSPLSLTSDHLLGLLATRLNHDNVGAAGSEVVVDDLLALRSLGGNSFLAANDPVGLENLS